MVDLGKAGEPLAGLQVVVAVLEPDDLYALGQGVGLGLVPRAEGVAGPLADQRRRPKLLQVRGLSRSGLFFGWNG